MKIILTLKDGTAATIPDASWQSETPELAEMLNALSVDSARSYLPHPMIEAAEDAAEILGASLSFEGLPPDDEPGVSPLTIH
jgi:hypothetical protein